MVTTSLPQVAIESKPSPILYRYINQTSHFQILRITDPYFPLERIVMPQQAIVFQALPFITLEIHSSEIVTAIFHDNILCAQLERV